MEICGSGDRAHLSASTLRHFEEGGVAITTITFSQIATAATPRGAILYGLTTSGVVYEYNFSREVWIPITMRALPQNGSEENVIGLRGPSFSAVG
jgi:hypothetical protein